MVRTIAALMHENKGKQTQKNLWDRGVYFFSSTSQKRHTLAAVAAIVWLLVNGDMYVMIARTRVVNCEKCGSKRMALMAEYFTECFWYNLGE